MSAVGDLWRQSTAALFAFLRRYWLLVSRPADYFEKYVRNKRARELRQTIGHTVLVITIATALFGATFALQTTSDIAPEFLKLILTKQYPLLIALLIATTPALLLFYIVYRIFAHSTSDLVFIYFNVLTLWVLAFLAYVAVCVLFAVMLIPAFYIFDLPFTIASEWFNDIYTSDSTWGWVIITPVLIAIYILLSSFYYVPLILFEKSTKRSTLFASGLCVSGLAVCFLAVYLVMHAAGISTFGPPLVEEMEEASPSRP
jgi:hypothetical protein